MSAPAREGTADLVVHNARVITMDDARPSATGLAVRGERFAAVGSDADVLATAGPSTRVVDLGGATLLPGFIDAHTHVELTAYAQHFWTDVRGQSVEQILVTVTRLAGETPPGGWIVLQGTFGQPLPARTELDRVAPDHPVAVRWTMHKFQLNSAALQVSGITRRTVAPGGVRIQRGADGEPTGIVEEGWDLLDWSLVLETALRPALEATLTDLFLRNGVTSVHEVAASAAGVRTFQELGRIGRIPRMGLALTAAPGHQPLVDVDGFAALGFRSGFGDDRTRLSAVKIFLDGGRDGAFRSQAIGGRAAGWGLLTRAPQHLAHELATAAQAGLQVWTHAIGDLAQEAAVSAVEQVAAAHPGLDHRFRIEHFFNESFGTDQLRRLVDAGGIAVPNPGFVFAEPDDPADRLPPGATKYALRTLRSVAGLVPGNSDTAGAQPMACNPWFTMKCMVQQRNRNGVVVSPEETVDLADALRAFTRDAAYATCTERDRGSIEAGKLADFVVVGADPFSTPAEELDAIPTRATVLGGAVVVGSLG